MKKDELLSTGTRPQSGSRFSTASEAQIFIRGKDQQYRVMRVAGQGQGKLEIEVIQAAHIPFSRN